MLKKLIKNKFILILLIILSLGSVVTLGRFIYKIIKKNFFLTQNFFFESDKLREQQFLYKINNYNGVDNYDIVINMNSIKNNKLKSSSDIVYDITYTCSSNANCSVSKSEGTIYSTSGQDFFVANIAPINSLDEGESMNIEITATSKSPYVKSLSANFMLTVGNYGLSYEIQDKALSPYLEVKVTNTLDYYVVREAFSTYSVDDKIDIPTYLNLSSADQNKCASAITNLTFNPNVVLYDNTNIVKGLISTQETTINNFNYVNQLNFKIEPISSIIIRFYKKDKTQNYTYPIVNPTSIVQVSFE